MPVIDADSHVDETEATWEYMAKSEEEYKPATVFPPSIHPIQARGGNGRFWMIDGYPQMRRLREDPETGEVLQPSGGTTVATRELVDIPARLRHMDELGIDVQVIYSTLFIDAVTTNPAEERALTNSYNRWVAERTAESHDRLRWIIVPSLLDLDNAMEQLRFGKENGACGVLMKGEGGVDGKGVVDPYFYPLYAEAGRLDLPICFHTGSAIPQRDLVERFSAEIPALTFPNGLLRTTFPILQAFHSLANQQIPDKFPETRWGFIEANSSWIPYMMYDLKRRQKKQAGRAAFRQFELADDLLAHNRFWVTCQMDEDLATISGQAGDDHLVIGTDYSHPDPAFDLQLVPILRERGGKGEIRPAVVEKILDDNPRALYAL